MTTVLEGPTPGVDYAEFVPATPGGVGRPAVPTWWRPDMPALYGGERVRVTTVAMPDDAEGVVGTVLRIESPSSNSPISLRLDNGHRWVFGFAEDRWQVLIDDEAPTDG